MAVTYVVITAYARPKAMVKNGLAAVGVNASDTAVVLVRPLLGGCTTLESAVQPAGMWLIWTTVRFLLHPLMKCASVHV